MFLDVFLNLTQFFWKDLGVWAPSTTAAASGPEVDSKPGNTACWVNLIFTLFKCPRA